MTKIKCPFCKGEGQIDNVPCIGMYHMQPIEVANFLVTTLLKMQLHQQIEAVSRLQPVLERLKKA
jgi:hypothetical protein